MKITVVVRYYCMIYISVFSVYKKILWNEMFMIIKQHLQAGVITAIPDQVHETCEMILRKLALLEYRLKKVTHNFIIHFTC